MSIVYTIKDLCYEKGISVGTLEKQLGFGNGSIYRWDKNSPTIEKVTKVADYFNISVDYLLGKTNQKPAAVMNKNNNTTNLTARDQKDIAKNLEKIVAELEDETSGPLFYGGELPTEDKEILKGILEQALVVAKVKNKAKYTPKKYRQDNDWRWLWLDIKRKANRYKRRFSSSDGLTLQQLYDIVDELDIELYEESFSELKGAYYYIERTKHIILDASMNDTEKRFVLSHELGHALFHRKENCFFKKQYTRLKTSYIELEADLFAAHLLLPEHIPTDLQDLSLKQLAMFYEVPVELMKIKLDLSE